MEKLADELAYCWRHKEQQTLDQLRIRTGDLLSASSKLSMAEPGSAAAHFARYLSSEAQAVISRANDGHIRYLSGVSQLAQGRTNDAAANFFSQGPSMPTAERLEPYARLIDILLTAEQRAGGSRTRNRRRGSCLAQFTAHYIEPVVA